jgi:NAD(P)-dependent dehydrogenase (short-subunit alcohol dehydrogenase family)
MDELEVGRVGVDRRRHVLDIDAVGDEQDFRITQFPGYVVGPVGDGEVKLGEFVGGGAIGGAIARRFAAEGASVCVADINLEGAEQTVTDIEVTGAKAVACPLDVADPAQAERAVQLTVERFGGPHVLVNVAAGPSPRGTVETMALEDFAREMTVNLTGYFLMAKYAVPAIRDAGGGAIINIASQLGHIGVPERPAYCASKGAILQLTRVMAIDHARDNIRVNSISPGAIDTPRAGSQPGAPQLTREQRGKSYLTGRIGRVDEGEFRDRRGFADRRRLPRLQGHHRRSAQAGRLGSGRVRDRGAVRQWRRKHDRDRRSGPRLSRHADHPA